MYTIKQTAQMLNLPAASLRYYDKLGIVSPARSQSGYRYYSEADIYSLRCVVVMKYAHFSLAEIKVVMERFQGCYDGANEECNIICKDVFTTRLEMLREAVVNLKQIIVLLGTLMPLIDNAETYFENQMAVRDLIDRIYMNIES